MMLFLTSLSIWVFFKHIDLDNVGQKLRGKLRKPRLPRGRGRSRPFSATHSIINPVGSVIPRMRTARKAADLGGIDMLPTHAE